MTVCMREYTPDLPPEGATLGINMTVLAPLTVTSHQFYNKLALEGVYFFFSSV